MSSWADPPANGVAVAAAVVTAEATGANAGSNAVVRAVVAPVTAEDTTAASTATDTPRPVGPAAVGGALDVPAGLGPWKCSVCLVSNEATCDVCPCCETGRDGKRVGAAPFAYLGGPYARSGAPALTLNFFSRPHEKV